MLLDPSLCMCWIILPWYQFDDCSYVAKRRKKDATGAEPFSSSEQRNRRSLLFPSQWSEKSSNSSEVVAGCPHEQAIGQRYGKYDNPDLSIRSQAVEGFIEKAGRVHR